MRGRIDGALQFGYQFGNGAAEVVSDVANRSPIMRLARLNPNGLEQRGGGDVVGMGNKRDRHPGVDRLIFDAELPRPPAGPVGEDESARDRQHEGDSHSQRTPSFSHNSV